MPEVGVRTNAQVLVGGGSFCRDERTETGAGTREGALSSGLGVASAGGSWDPPTEPSGRSCSPTNETLPSLPWWRERGLTGA